MSLKKKEISVEEKTDQVAQAIVELVRSIEKHAKDGFQPGADLPAIITENLMSLGSAIVAVKELPAEVRENPAAFTRAWAVAGTDVMEIFVPGKPVV